MNLETYRQFRHDLELCNAVAYADRRRKETKQAYIVSDFKRVLLDCPDNRKVLESLGESIVYRS